MVSSLELRAAFEGLPSPVLDRIAAMATSCRYRPRQVIFRAGQAADYLYIVLEGRVRVSRETANHVELLHGESAGGVLGEIPVFGGGAFPATAVAVETTHCARLPKAAVERLLGEHPEFARFAVKRLAVRAQSLLQRIDELTATTVTARLARHVLQCGDDVQPFTLGMSQSELADELGTAREVVVRALRSLIRLQAVQRAGRSRFVVVNRELLRSIAGE